MPAELHSRYERPQSPWNATGQGASFALLSIGAFSQVIEVPVATVNQKAGLPATDACAKLFANFAELSGGIR
jgi:hypothetical protein